MDLARVQKSNKEIRRILARSLGHSIAGLGPDSYLNYVLSMHANSRGYKKLTSELLGGGSAEDNGAELVHLEDIDDANAAPADAAVVDGEGDVGGDLMDVDDEVIEPHSAPVDGDDQGDLPDGHPDSGCVPDGGDHADSDDDGDEVALSSSAPAAQDLDDDEHDVPVPVLIDLTGEGDEEEIRLASPRQSEAFCLCHSSRSVHLLSRMSGISIRQIS